MDTRTRRMTFNKGIGGAPQAPADAPSAPRSVIRGESSEEEGLPGKAFPAFTDFLNVTFPLPEWENKAGAFFSELSQAVGGAFGVMEDTGRGLHGYRQSFKFQRGGVRFALGGQAGTGFLSVPGEGCALVPSWSAFVGLLRDDLGARITRWDGAVDDFQGLHSVDGAVELYRAGAFNAGGRKPSCNQLGNWIEPDGSGRTFYVGKRRNGKLLRVYEKGMQLGAAWNPWTRWEVELHNVDREIPWAVVDAPGEFIAGAYPALSWVSGLGTRIPTLQRSDTISYERIVFYARRSYGRLVNAMLEREGSEERVVDRLRRGGAPRRLEVTTYLRIHEGVASVEAIE